MKSIILSLTIYLCVTPLVAQISPKVLILGIDGCRQDAIVAATTPHLDGLIANGTYSLDALTEPPTWSGVGWSGMLTGVWRDKHGVSDNSFSGSNYGQYPHIFNIIEDCDPTKVTASIVHWGPINSQILDQADYELIVGTDLAVQTEAVDYLTNNDPDILFLHFDDVDHAGHSNGFSPTVPAYLQAIEEVDTQIGQVIAAVINRPNYSNEEWIIMVSTDHGGTTSGHGGNSFEERNIFVILSGDNIINQELSKTTTQKNVSQALIFNGIDSYIDLPDSPVYDFGTSQDFTLECMIRVSNINGDAAIVSNKDWGNGANNGFVFSYVSANGPQWKVNIGDGTNRLDVSGSAVDDGAWHHLAVSFDRDGLMMVYEDGVFVQSLDMTSIGDIDTPYPLTIGQDGTHTYGNWFDGAIAEVKLWNAALDENTIVQNACLSPNASHPNIADLIGYWPINEGSGSLINDLSTTDNDGALSSSTTEWRANAGRLTCLDYADTPRIVDIAVTALDYLCGSVDPALDLDGTSLLSLVLPAELLAFTAAVDGHFNHINWKVGIQKNVQSYELQRTINGQDHYISIGTQLAQANLNTYSIVDKDPPNSAYYRLKIIDTDGRIEYSKLVLVDRKEAHSLIKRLSPNPANAYTVLQIQHEGDQYQNCQLKIIDPYGRVLNTMDYTLANGLNELRIETHQLKQGLYYLVFEKEGKRQLLKFVKH